MYPSCGFHPNNCNTYSVPIPSLLKVKGFIESRKTLWVLVNGLIIPEFVAVINHKNFMDIAVNSSIIEGVIEGPFAWFSRGGYTSLRKLSRDELTNKQ
jgi:hypothetical protein